LKRIFEGYLSPQISSKSSSPQRERAWKKGEKVLKKRKREKKKKKEKVQESLQIKRESQYFERRKNIATSKFFLYEPILFPSIIPFQKHFSKSFEKISQLFLDHPLT
jgi:hypothetical protein